MGYWLNFHLQKLALALLLAVGTLVPGAASAVEYTFSTPIAGDSVPVTLQLTDAAGGGVDVLVSIPAGQGDLLGLFGNVSNEALVPGMAIANDPTHIVTQWTFSANNVSKVGGGNVMTPVGSWDWGLRFGNSGSAGGAVLSASFRITGGGITVSQLTGATNQGWRFGVRIQSTPGPDGSAKIGLGASQPPNGTGQAPTVTIASPANGLLTRNTPVVVTGAVTGTAPVTVSVNSVAATMSGSSYSASVPLVEGTNTLTATATNVAGSANASVTVKLDTTPPVVTITSPGSGLLTAATSVLVTGNVTDANPITSFTLNGTAVELTAGAFSTTVPLSVGANPINASATDAAGNIGTAGISVTRAVVPTVAIAAPANGLLTRNTPIIVSGTFIGTAPVTISVNGVTATLSGSSYSASVPLVEGNNTLTATATNAVGSANSSVTVKLDTTPPVVTITAPADGLVTAGTSGLVTGTVTDASPISAFTINGVAVTLTGGAFSTTVPLAVGTNPINASATDAAGNVGAAGISVTRALAPTIAIAAPSNGLLTGTTPITVSGTFTGTAPVTIAVNGVPATISGSSFSASVPLVEGVNTLTATAANAVGSASASVSVTLDTTPPVVTIQSPADGSTTAAASTLVTGTVTDVSPIAAFTINGAPVPLTSGSFSTTVPLALGANPIAASAADAAGNTGSAAISVNRAAPPAIAISSPADGSFSTSTPITVSGTVTGTAPIAVNVNGVAASVSGGAFSANVALSAGSNPLVATATNAVGSASAQVTVLLVGCQPGSTRSCYSGPPGTAGVGICAAGTETCAADGSGYGGCTQTLPAAAESCSNGQDDDCDGAADLADTECSNNASGLAITVDSPPNGESVSSLLLDVAGRVTADAESVTVNGLTATVSAGHYVAHNVVVSPGLSLIEAVATRGSDHASAVSVVAFRAAPVVVITSPAEGATLRSASTDVHGVVDDFSAFVEVNGVPARVESSGEFIAYGVPLAPGPNTLRALATNPSGAQGRDEVAVVRDDAAPAKVGIAIRSRRGSLVTSVEDYKADVVADFAERGVQNPVFDRPIERIAYSGFDSDRISVYVFSDSADESIGLLGFDGVSQSAEPIPIDQLPVYLAGYGGCDPESDACATVPASVSGKFDFEPVSFAVFQIQFGSCGEGFCDPLFTGLQTLEGVGARSSAQLEFVLEGYHADSPVFTTVPPVGTSSTLAGGNVAITGAVSYSQPLLRELTWTLHRIVSGGCSDCPIVQQGTSAIRDGAFELPDLNLPAGTYYVDLQGYAAVGFRFVDVLWFVVDPNAPAVSLVGSRSGEVVEASHVSRDLNFAAPTTLISVNGVPDGRNFPAGVSLHALELDLAIGLNPVTLTFDSGQGERTFSFSVVRVEEFAPVLILSPEDQFYVPPEQARRLPAIARVVVSVPLGTPGVTVNGVTAQATADPRIFSADVPLHNGANELLARAVPSGDGQAILVYADADPPSAWAVIPRDGARTVATRVDVAGLLTEQGTVRLFEVDPFTGEATGEIARANTQRVSAERGLNLLLSGNSAIGDLDPEALSFALMFFKFYRFDIADLPLHDGVNTFSLVMEDAAGNRRTQLLRYIKSSSGLVLTAPADGSSTPATSTALQLEAFADLTIEAVRVGADRIGAFSGQRVTPGTVNLTNVRLRPGRNEIQIVYRRTGAEASDLLSLSIFSTAPPTRPRIHGRVTANAGGAPISGALVAIQQGAETHTTATSADGSWSLIASPGALSGHVSAEGYVPVDFDETLGPDDDFNVDVSLLSWAESPTQPLESGVSLLLLTPPSGVTTDWEAVGVWGRLPADATSVAVNGVSAQIRGRTFEVPEVPLAMGSNTLTAIVAYADGRIAQVTRSITRAADPVHMVKIFSPPDHASIPGGGLVVRGFVSAKDATVLVGTRGFVPVTNGIFAANDVFPKGGATSIEAISEREGSTVAIRDLVPVSVEDPAAAMVLSSDPAGGAPPLSATLTVKHHFFGFPVSRLDFDLDGDGALDIVGSDSGQVTTSFASARPFKPRVFAEMPSGVELTAAVRVQVDLPAQVGPAFAQGNPVDLARAPEGDLYVLDASTSTVSRYTIDGNLVSSFGSSGSGPAQLLYPQGLAVDSEGLIYVADTGNDRIQVFAPDGSWVRTIGSSGQQPGEFSVPIAVAVDHGEVVVSDNGNARIQVIREQVIRAVGVQTDVRRGSVDDPRGLAQLPGTGMTVASGAGSLVQIEPTAVRTAPIASTLPDEAQLHGPTDLAAGEEMVLIADGLGRKVVVLDERLAFRRVLPLATPPVAVLPSSRREVEALFVTDGGEVREIRLPVPSPLPVVQALRERLLASDVPGALALIHPLRRELFSRLYVQTLPNLPADAAAMGAMNVDLLRAHHAIVSFATVGQFDGSPFVTTVPVGLDRLEDGTWRIVDY